MCFNLTPSLAFIVHIGDRLCLVLEESQLMLQVPPLCEDLAVILRQCIVHIIHVVCVAISFIQL